MKNIHQTSVSVFLFAKRIFLSTALAALVAVASFAQIGINTPNPDASAMLEVKATDRGMLIPRVTTNARSNITSPANGLMVFDTDLNAFFYYSVAASKWLVMNTWTSEGAATSDVSLPAGRKVGIGKTNPSTALDVNGTTTTTTLTVSGTATATTFVGNGTVPVGGIIMWSGTTVPAGWALCDGSTVNGVQTPDLRGRFIVGTGKATGPGAGPTNYVPANRGGEEKHTLTTNEMPTHTHAASASTDGAHSHEVYVDEKQNGNYPATQIRGDDGKYGNGDEVEYVGNSGNHTHTITVQNAGQGGAHENRPPYFALAYIMRVQ